MTDDHKHKKEIMTSILGGLALDLKKGEVPHTLVVGQLTRKGLEDISDRMSTRTYKALDDYYTKTDTGSSMGIPLVATVIQVSPNKYRAEVNITKPMNPDTLEKAEGSLKKLKSLGEELVSAGFKLLLSDECETTAESTAHYCAGFMSTLLNPRTLSFIELPEALRNKIAEASRDHIEGRHNHKGDCTDESDEDSTTAPTVEEDPAIALIKAEAEKMKQYEELVATYGLENIQAIAKRAGVHLPSDLIKKATTKKATPKPKK